MRAWPAIAYGSNSFCTSPMMIASQLTWQPDLPQAVQGCDPASKQRIFILLQRQRVER